MNIIGVPRRRVDGRAKVTGQTRFADDVVLPRMVHCKLLRSTVPHARVIRIDALYGLGRDREALQEEDRILKANPPLFHIYTHLGWIRLARGERAEAAARFQRALRYQPNSQVARDGLARAQETASP